MGVTGLWKILDELELGERKDLSFLCGKRVAVDLSGWVVQAMTCPGLNKSKTPHLKNLFYRSSRLLKNGIFPIFILEGKVPGLKEAVFKKRNHQGASRNNNLTRSRLDKLLNECKQFLQILGVPCIKSSGEAEALCAFLYTNNIVDGVITEDGDAFLYGADTVLRDFSADRKEPHVKEYSLKSTRNTLGLNQPKLIALALLLGCDYDQGGIPGIGQETAVKLLSELQGHDLLQRFKDWKQKSESELFPGYDSAVKKQGIHCKQCSHFGSLSDHETTGCIMCNSTNSCLVSDGKNPCSCTWHKTQEISWKRKIELKVYHAAKKLEDFPNLQIVEEFKNYTDDIPDDSQLDWKCPNLEEFKVKALDYFNWSWEKSIKNGFPLVTLWQQIILSKNPLISENTFLFKPIKILKKATEDHKRCFKVQWSHIDNNVSNIPLENLSTLEIEERFKIAYPTLSEEFCNLNKPKSETKTQNKSPKSAKINDKKVITENTVDSLYTLTPIKESFPNVRFDSPQNESADSFSYLPLCERIKIISECFPKKKEESLKCRNTSLESSLSPVNPIILLNNEVTSPDFLSDNTHKKSSFCINLNQISLLNAEIESLTEEIKELKIVDSDSKPDLHSSINFKTNIDKPYACLEFSDSDESYVDILQNDVESSYNLSCNSPRRTSVLVNNTESISEDILNNVSSCLKNQLDFLSLSIHKQAKYSIKDISPKSSICSNSSDKSFNFVCNSTPKLNLRISVLQKIMHLSATKESPVHSYRESSEIYSPIIFDSSFDDSI